MTKNVNCYCWNYLIVTNYLNWICLNYYLTMKIVNYLNCYLMNENCYLKMIVTKTNCYCWNYLMMIVTNLMNCFSNYCCLMTLSLSYWTATMMKMSFLNYCCLMTNSQSYYLKMMNSMPRHQ